jgi:signal transduction histidine kinase
VRGSCGRRRGKRTDIAHAAEVRPALGQPVEQQSRDHALIFAPLVLCWAGVRVGAITRPQALEGSVLAALIVVLALLPSQRDVPYIVFPVLIWAALRGGPRGASGAVALVTTLTVFNTAHHAGPFVRATTTQSLLATQLFVAAAALTSLVLGAVIEERHAALQALREKERRLRDSRARIVRAGDTARRRLERNLHDGAQQRPVSLALTLRLARLQLERNPAATEQLLTESTRLPSTVEAAVYYIAAEGLTNIAKYAHATSATLQLDANNSSVVLRIGDNGRRSRRPDSRFRSARPRGPRRGPRRQARTPQPARPGHAADRTHPERALTAPWCGQPHPTSRCSRTPRLKVAPQTTARPGETLRR